MSTRRFGQNKRSVSSWLKHHQGFEKALRVKDKIVIADFYAEYASPRVQIIPHNIDDVPRPVGAVPARFWDQS